MFTWEPNADPKKLVSNPEWIESHRNLTLLKLDALYLEINQLKADVEAWKESAAREVWTWQQMFPKVDPDTHQRIQIDRRVNMMDPDFSFQSVILENKEVQPS